MRTHTRQSGNALKVSRPCDVNRAVRRHDRSWLYTMEWLEGRCLLSGIGPLGSEFRVNTYTGGAPRSTAVAMNDSGSSVVAWSNYDVTGGHVGIYAQRYNRLGVPQGGEFRVNTFTSDHFNWQFASPAVAMSPSGNFVVTWISPEQDGSGGGIFAQRYDAFGAAQGAEFRVNSTTVGDQVFPSIAMDDSGRFVVAWRGEEADGGSFPCGIFAQRFSASGSPAGSEIHVNTYVNGEQQNPTIACDLLGNFMVAWESYAPDHQGVFAQRFNISGVAQGSEFQVSTGGSPAAAMDSNGDFVIAWDGGAIHALRYDAAGAAQGVEFQVSTSAGAFDPAVAMDRAGHFAVTWADGDGSDSGVYARRYDAWGAATGGEFRVNTSTDASQQAPAIGMGGAGNSLIAWESFGIGSGIRAQRYGNPPGPPEFGDLPNAINTTEFPLYHDSTGLWAQVWIPVSATDPDTPQAGLAYTVDNVTPEHAGYWGGDPYFETYHPYYGMGRWLRIYIGDGPYQQTINIRVTDDTGLSDTATIVVNVANRPPDVGLYYGIPTNVLAGQQVQFGFASNDLDGLEGWIDFGDGVVSSPSAMYGVPGIHDYSKKLFETHTYFRSGTFAATCYVRDDDGAISTLKFNVAVAPYGVDASGVLRVGGTTGNDTIHVSPAAGGKVNLFIGGALKGVFAANAVIAYGNGGDDTLDAAEKLNVPVEFHGGPGNDLLVGAMANDVLMGDEGDDRIQGRGGHDILVGSVGNDRLRGTDGRDLVLGGTGIDSLYGDAGDDILIAGPTSYDADLVALKQILNEWISARSYGVRVANIRDGTGSGDRVNGSYFFKGGSTVFDDGVEDWLTACGETDWFFASTATGDKLVDRASNEIVDWALA